MAKGKAKVKDPRKLGAVAVRLLAVLAEYDVTDVEWGKKKHASLSFAIGGVRKRMNFPCTPRSAARRRT
jgi:hypothetical protein